jgi:hypothetical protein
MLIMDSKLMRPPSWQRLRILRTSKPRELLAFLVSHHGEQKGEQTLAHCMIHLASVSRPCHWNIVVVRRNTAIGNFCRCQNEITPQ